MHYSNAPPPPYAPALFDASVIGRDISRPYGSNWGMQAGMQVQFTPALLAGIGGPRAEEFVGFAALLNGTADAATGEARAVGNRVFYITDFALHTVGTAAAAARHGGSGGRLHADSGNGIAWSVSVKMASTRTLRCECINSENKHGLHLSDGAMYLSLTGYEFVDTFPLWDFMRLPGTTVFPYAVPWLCGGAGTTAFVGGASDGAGLGSAVQDYVAAFNESLAMRRSTFFFPSLFVGLGANITATSPAAAARVAWTGIAQARLTGTGVFTSAGGADAPLPANTNTSLPDTAWWVWEGGVGYVLLDRLPGAARTTGGGALPTLHVSNVATWGLWQDIGAMSGNVTGALFTLWLEHAAPVAGASYAYAILPNLPLPAFQAAAAALLAPVASGGLAVIRNDGGVQAVVHGASNALHATVFALDGGRGSVAVVDGGAGWNVTVNSVGAFIVAQAAPAAGEARGAAGAGSLAFTVAEPSQPAAGWSVQVGIDRALAAASGPNGTSCTPAAADFATPPNGGQSQSITCALA
jgi:hypothetical protein